MFFHLVIPFSLLLDWTLSDCLHKMCFLIFLYLLLVGALLNCLYGMCFLIPLCMLVGGALSNRLHKMCVVFMEINIYIFGANLCTQRINMLECWYKYLFIYAKSFLIQDFGILDSNCWIIHSKSWIDIHLKSSKSWNKQERGSWWLVIYSNFTAVKKNHWKSSPSYRKETVKSACWWWVFNILNIHHKVPRRSEQFEHNIDVIMTFIAQTETKSTTKFVHFSTQEKVKKRGRKSENKSKTK